MIRFAESETHVPRADATRHGDQFLEIATRVFVSAGTEPSMRAIAREAGAGITTLWSGKPVSNRSPDYEARMRALL